MLFKALGDLSAIDAARRPYEEKAGEAQRNGLAPGYRAPSLTPATFVRNDDPTPAGMVVLHYFRAPDATEAWHYFKTRLIPFGCPPDISVIGNAGDDEAPDATPAQLWRYHGDSPYLNRFINGANLHGTVALKFVQNDQRSRFITNLLNQLQEVYFRNPKERGVSRLNPAEAQHVRETLKRAEQKVQELATVTAAMARAVDDAHRAFGLDNPRTFTVPTAAPPIPTPERDPEPTATPNHHDRHPRPRKSGA